MFPLKLNTYQEYLEKENYAENTIRSYIHCMEDLKEDNIFEDSSSQEIYDSINREDWSNSTKRMHLKALVLYEEAVIGKPESMLKGGLRLKLYQETQEETDGIEPVKSLKAYRNIITRCEDDVVRTAMLLQLESGLRIGEITALAPKDIRMREGHIWLKVAPQKTIYGRIVKVFDNKTLYADLQKIIRGKDRNEVLFPSENTITDYLSEKGGKSHDLRRHNSKMRYEEQRLEGLPKGQAIKIVAEQLGHKETDNTIRYVGELYRKDESPKYKKVVF